jgi:threonine/homoserine/homoserine lactone efflux protein
MNSPIFQAIGDTLTIIAGVMISPIRMAGLIVVLTSRGGRYKAVAFAAGFFVALWMPTFVMAWLGHQVEGISGTSGSPMWRSIIHGGLGAFLLALGVLSFIKWSREYPNAHEPKWMKRIDSASLFAVFGIGIVLLLVNPKNLTLVLSAATDYAHAALGTVQLSIVVTTFAVLGSLLVFVTIVLELVAPKTSTKILGKMRPWLITHNGLILAVILVIMGMHLLGKAISAMD